MPHLNGDSSTIDNNRIAGAFYVDANFTYKLVTESAGDLSFFLNVSNALNKAPPSVPNSGGLLYAGKGTNVTPV